MMKVNKVNVLPVCMETLRAGDTFIYEGSVYMMVMFDRTLRPVNLERANWATNIHSDTRVIKCDCELNVTAPHYNR